ncbi:ATPase, T2SS/T4P/T4SS family [Denitromonas sp.]|uniref:ATPase, T2SS/T4P/T4SS family n=1 Tax=Denitromonas sp. TaxID=2734609 RepID=UPI002AFE8512|nr:ATPase, T2SS/T4P/T4SS family [Denitromonas sp.]
MPTTRLSSISSNWLLQYAFEQRASDIHIEPRREVCNVRFRIDGVMHLVYQTPVPVAAAITNRIKLMGRMDVVEKRRPQDGRIKTQSGNGEEIELRLSNHAHRIRRKAGAAHLQPGCAAQVLR